LQRLFGGGDFVIIACAVLTQYNSVTDRQMPLL